MGAETPHHTTPNLPPTTLLRSHTHTREEAGSAARVDWRGLAWTAGRPRRSLDWGVSAGFPVGCITLTCFLPYPALPFPALLPALPCPEGLMGVSWMCPGCGVVVG